MYSTPLYTQEKVHQSSSARLLSPVLEDSELDLVSSHVGERWEPLAASLGFRDTDDPEFSDRSGEKACQLMLVQWRGEQKGKECLPHTIDGAEGTGSMS